MTSTTETHLINNALDGYMYLEDEALMYFNPTHIQRYCTDMQWSQAVHPSSQCTGLCFLGIIP